MRGKFISFEGGEGGGKSTQAARLAGFLRSKGLDVIETREPGGTQQGEDLRDLLVQGDPDRWLPLSELLMMTAARVEHVHRLIEPALAAGKWLICARLECMIFGMGDYAASQGLVMENIGLNESYPGDIFHYPRYHMTIAARAAGLDAVDGPFVDFKNEAAYRIECQRSLSLGMVGKWAIHPSQIDTALDVFSPSQEDVDFAREVIAVYRQAEADGIGSVGHKGVMVDAASARLFQNTVNRADLIGM